MILYSQYSSTTTFMFKYINIMVNILLKNWLWINNYKNNWRIQKIPNFQISVKVGQKWFKYFSHGSSYPSQWCINTLRNFKHFEYFWL